MLKFVVYYHDDDTNIEIEAEEVQPKEGFLFFIKGEIPVLILSSAANVTVHTVGNGIYEED